MQDTEFKTTDIALAAYLNTKHSLVRIDRRGNQGVFVFTDASKMDAMTYMRGEALVEPLRFHNNVRSLTSAVKHTVVI